MIKRIFLLLVFLSLLSPSFLAAATVETPSPRPWFKPFVPTRTFYVSPSGNGDGRTPSSAMSFNKALSSGNPGDLYWLLEGTYRGDFRPSRAGTEARPIVFRAEQGKHVLIEGGFTFRAGYNWIWGFEISDQQNVQDGGGAEMLAPGIRVINNVIHNQYGNIGIGAWQQGKGQVIYGNILYRQTPNNNNPHNIYAQNDFKKWGYKYIVNNMILDASEATFNTYNVHCYTEGGLITGLWLEKNILRNGKFLIGGFNAPAENEVVKENYFYKSKIQFGYRRPTQVRFQNNYVVRSPLFTEWVWGVGETIFPQSAPSIYTGNEFIRPPGPHVRFSTSAYLASGRCEGCPRIRPNDVFDQNKYSAPFKGTFYADSKRNGVVNLATWRKITAAAGNAFDVHSTEVPAPKGVKTAILKNDYDPSRAHMAVYNFSGAKRVRVDLSSFLPNGTGFAINDAKQTFQSPVAAGIYSGPVEIPCESEFRVFLITRR